MARIKQSVAWWCFAPEKMTPEELVRGAADMGYEAIDLVGPEYWPLVVEHGLKISAVGGHQALTDGLNRRENRVRIEGELRESIARAATWSIPNLVCFSGNRSGLSDLEGAEITAETLRACAPLAEDAGVTLVLELLNSKVDHPDYQCDHTAWGVELCKRVGSERFKLLYDIYHMQIMEGDVIRTIQDNIAYLGHFHTGGNPGRNEIDSTQELNYARIAQAIVDTDFKGYFAHEFIPKKDPMTSLRKAVDLCDV